MWLCSIFISLLFVAGIKAQACGTNFDTNTAKTGDITFPAALTYNENCSYRFVLPDKTTGLYLMLKALVLPEGASLTFYNGDSRAPTILKLDATIDDVQVGFTLAQNSVLKLATGPNYAKDNFKSDLSYSVDSCAVDLTGPDGRFRSPVFAATPGGQASCTYKLTPEQRRSVGLSFESVDLKQGSLTVRDGDEKNTTYTNGATHAADEIDEKELTIILTLNTSQVQTAFIASYVGLTSACSKKIAITANQTVTKTSPGYPNNYPNDLDCRLILYAPDNMVLAYDVSDMAFGDPYDQLNLNNGDRRTSPVLMQLSSAVDKPDYAVLTSGASLWVHFRSDESLTAKGFSITVKPRTFGRLMYDSGYISLTGKKTNPDVVMYQLRTEPGKQLLVTMKGAAFQPTNIIAMSDGLNPEPEHRLAKFSSDTPFYPVFSRSNTMTIEASGFVNNASFAANFVSQVVSTENVVSVGETDTYSLVDNSYPKQAEWLIQNQENKIVVLKLSTANVGPSCTVNVHRGLAESSLKLMELKSSYNNLPDVYIEDGVRVSYQKEGNGTATPTDSLLLQGAYKKISGCDGPLVDGGSADPATFTSPGYPDRYPYNAYCKRTYKIPAKQSVHVYFDLGFDLAQDHSVSIQAKVLVEEDDDSVADGTQTETMVSYGQYYGGTVPSDMIITGEELYVNFSSLYNGNTSNDNWSVGGGYSATLKLLECGGNLTDSKGSGEIGSPAAVANKSASCVWILSIPPAGKTNGSVNIIQYSLELMGYTNQSFVLTLRDGASIHAEEIQVELKDGKQDKQLTRYNALYVSYDQAASAKPIKDMGFKITYETYECLSSQQCDNGVCMHPDWRCNGIDDCGDGSDEAGCICVAGKRAYKPWVLFLALLSGSIFGIVLAFAALAVYWEIKAQRKDGAYNKLH